MSATDDLEDLAVAAFAANPAEAHGQTEPLDQARDLAAQLVRAHPERLQLAGLVVTDGAVALTLVAEDVLHVLVCRLQRVVALGRPRDRQQEAPAVRQVVRVLDLNLAAALVGQAERAADVEGRINRRA